MTVTGKTRGHAMYYDGADWRFRDTDELTVGSRRPCGLCNRQRTDDGHDGCIRTMSGVENACCGHGETADAYIVYDGGHRKRRAGDRGVCRRQRWAAIVNDYPDNWQEIATAVKDAAGWQCVRCSHPHDVDAGRVLTVHHLDMDKANCRWWNLAALCQRCHLSVQARVVLERPWIFEHSAWFKIYAAGYYAHVYLELELNREQAAARLEELLELERIA